MKEPNKNWRSVGKPEVTHKTGDVKPRASFMQKLKSLFKKPESKVNE